MRTLMLILIVSCSILSNLTSQTISHIETADNQLNQGLYLEAINTLSNYIERYPDSREGYIKRAQVHSIIGMNTESERDLERAYILDPLHILYGQESMANKLSAKEKYSYDWIREHPESIYKSPVNEKDYMAFIKSMDMDEVQNSLIINAIQSLATNKLKDADHFINQVDPYLSNTALIFDIKGLISLKTGHIEEALDLFTLSTIHMPEFALAYHNQSICYKLLGKQDQAEEALIKAIDLNSQVATFYFTKALLHEKSGETLNAEKYYLSALSLNENHPQATSNYAILMQTLGHYDEAIRLIDKTMAQNPNNAKNLFLRGGIHLSFGDYEAAIEDLELYKQDHPNDPNNLYNLGLAYLLNKDHMNGCYVMSEAQKQGFDTSKASMITYSCQNL